MRIRLSELRRIIRSVVAETVTQADSGEDLNDDGQNDFEDVMIARMMASGVPKEKAVKKGTTAAKAAQRRSQ